MSKNNQTSSALARNGKHALRMALYVLCALLVLLAPLFTSKYVMRILIMLYVYAILSVSLNMLSGYLGEISLGHSIFFAVGAYTASVLATKFGMNYWLAVLFACLVAGAFSALLGAQTLSVSGAYLAIVSLGYYYVLRTIIIIWEGVTGGAIGIFNIPTATLFGTKLVIKNGGAYYHILAFLLLTLLIDHLVLNSKFGRTIKAVREDCLAANLVGIYTNRYKIFAFAYSGFFAGLAGAFYGQFITYINPANFTFDMSVTILAMVVLGGRGNVKGALLGACILSPLGELIRQLTTLMKNAPSWMQIENPDQWRFVIYGLLLIVMMQVRPLGLLGGLDKRPYRLPKGVVVKDGGKSDGVS
mgnify:FL=1